MIRALKLRHLAYTLFILTICFGLANYNNYFNPANYIYSYLPTDASLVAQLDLEAVWEKGDFEEFQKSNFYQNLINLSKKENPFLSQVLSKPFDSGLDLNNKLFYFEKNVEKSKKYSGFYFNIYNYKKLNYFLQSLASEDIINQGGKRLLHLNDELALIWNRSWLALVNKHKTIYNAEELYKFLGTGKQDNYHQIMYEKAFNKSKNDLVVVSDFIDQADELIPYKLNEWTKLNWDDHQNHIVSTFNFGKGKIEGISKLILSDEWQAFFDKTLQNNSTLLLPGTIQKYDLAACGSFNFNELTKWLKKDLLEQKLLNEYELTMSDVVTSFEGQTCYAFKQHGPKTGSELFLFEIEDEESIGEFLDILEESDYVIKKAENYYLLNTPRIIRWMDRHYPKSTIVPSGNILIKNKVLYLSDDEEALSEISAAEEEEVRTNKQDSPHLSMYFNNTVENPFKFLNFPIIESLEINGKEKDYNIEIQMKDAKENSLKSFLNLFNTNYLKNKVEVQKAAEKHSI